MIASLPMPPAPVPVVANAQLGCTLAMPGVAPAMIDIDLQTKKPGTAALSADRDSPFARISASSDAVVWPTTATGAVAFTVATGTAQYRVELIFVGDLALGQARARIVSLDPTGVQPTIAQGFCTLRSGKRLAPRNLVRMAFDPAHAPSLPLRVQPVPAGIVAGDCRLVTADRVVHPVGYNVLSATGNETTVAYKFDAIAGVSGGTATGVRFHLVAPTSHLIAVTVALAGQPPVYVRSTFERSGNWIDFLRGSAIVAQGECGTALPVILAPAGGN